VDAGRFADHLERDSGERQSPPDTAVQAATVKGVPKEMNDPTHGGQGHRAVLERCRARHTDRPIPYNSISWTEASGISQTLSRARRSGPERYRHSPARNMKVHRPSRTRWSEHDVVALLRHRRRGWFLDPGRHRLVVHPEHPAQPHHSRLRVERGCLWPGSSRTRPGARGATTLRTIVLFAVWGLGLGTVLWAAYTLLLR